MISDQRLLLFEELNSAIKLEKSGQHLTALDHYLSIIERDKDFREAYINLGALYARLERLNDAMFCYNEALRIKDDFVAHFNIGSIYYKQSDYKKAILSLTRAKKLNTSFVLAPIVMGLSFSRLKNRKAAETSFLDVLDIDTHNEVALTALSILYVESGRMDESLPYIEKVLSLNPSNTKIKNLRSKILYGLGRLEESAKDIKSLKNTAPRYRRYNDFIKHVPVEMYTDRLGTIDEKIDALEKKTLDDASVQNYMSLSLCCMLKGETDKAIDYLFAAKNAK